MTGSDLVGSRKSWGPVEGSCTCLGALVLMHCAGRLTRLLGGREQCLGASIFFWLETISVSFLLMIPPCSFGWLLLSQCSFPWYSLIYQEFLHPVFLLEMLFTKTSSCFLSGVSIVSVFWRQTMFLFLLLESSLLFSAYLYHALFWPFWWRDRYHGQRFIPAYRSQSSWACSG